MLNKPLFTNITTSTIIITIFIILALAICIANGQTLFPLTLISILKRIFRQRRVPALLRGVGCEICEKLAVTFVEREYQFLHWKIVIRMRLKEIVCMKRKGTHSKCSINMQLKLYCLESYAHQNLPVSSPVGGPMSSTFFFL